MVLQHEKKNRFGKSANNFSGSYFSLGYERSVRQIQGAMHHEHISINNGLQSRFLSNGFVDFSLGLFYVSPDALNYRTDNSGSHGFQVRNLILASRSAVGLAFADWKKNGKAPLCDVLHCDYLIKQQFKIKLPEIILESVYGPFAQRSPMNENFERLPSQSKEVSQMLPIMPYRANIQLRISRQRATWNFGITFCKSVTPGKVRLL